jgi:hypothetical protein
MKSMSWPATVAALLFASCALFSPSPKVLERQIGLWDGKTQDQVVHAWGRPTRITDDGSGGHILIYVSRLQQSYGGGAASFSDTSPAPPPGYGPSAGFMPSASDLPSVGGSNGGIAVIKGTARLWVHPDGTIYAHDYTKQIRVYN